jgi:hypothetical protein
MLGGVDDEAAVVCAEPRLRGETIYDLMMGVQKKILWGKFVVRLVQEARLC